MLKKFMSYYKPHKTVFAFDMAASLLVSVITVVYPIVTRLMLNDFIPNKKYDLIVVFGIVLFIIYFTKMFLDLFIQYKGHVMGTKIQAAMRKDLFIHLQKLPYNFFDTNETGKLMSRLTNDLFEVSELAHHGPEMLIISTVSVLVAFCYLATIDIWLTLIIFACVPILAVVAASMQKKMKKAFMDSRVAVAEINASVESSISGIRVTKAFTNSEKEAEKFDVGNGAFVEARSRAYKKMGQFHSLTTFITNIFNVIVLIAGGFFLYAGRIDFADYSAFILSVNLFLTPIMTFINFIEQFQNGLTGFKRFFEIMQEKPEEDSDDAVDAGVLNGDIEFKDVFYGYDRDKDVLKGVNLKIQKGNTFALVGPSGGGKTTICHLIPHFYDVDEGEILIDGQNIDRFTRQSLRKNIGIVQQDIYLFNASIRENILYGKLDATDEEVILAAKRANIHDYVMSLEKGYDTVIGERGITLSGGQKQRLGIARVFLKNPPILILDEATSALDNTTELIIQKSLDELCKGRTTLVVAHRLSTVKNADEIAVIADGKIVEQGTHDFLIEKNGAYAELYNQQFKK